MLPLKMDKCWRFFYLVNGLIGLVFAHNHNVLVESIDGTGNGMCLIPSLILKMISALFPGVACVFFIIFLLSFGRRFVGLNSAASVAIANSAMLLYLCCYAVMLVISISLFM